MRTTSRTLEPNVPYRVRTRLAPLITRLGRTLEQPEYRLHDTEFVGTIQQPLDEFTETLQKRGVEWDPLAGQVVRGRAPAFLAGANSR